MAPLTQSAAARVVASLVWAGGVPALLTAIMSVGGRNRGSGGGVAAADFYCTPLSPNTFKVGESSWDLRQTFGAFPSLLHLTRIVSV